jgi:hypothetical protein
MRIIYDSIVVVSTAERKIIEEIRSSGEPLSQDTLISRADQPETDIKNAIARLRGQEMIRKLYNSDGTDRFCLTSWPEETNCPLCDELITGKNHYELTLSPQGGTTDGAYTSTLHAKCAHQLIDNIAVNESGVNFDS